MRLATHENALAVELCKLSCKLNIILLFKTENKRNVKRHEMMFNRKIATNATSYPELLLELSRETDLFISNCVGHFFKTGL